MPRQDYDEIKNKFGSFIASWKTRNTEKFDELFDPEVLCYMSIVKAYTDGSQHSRFGIKNFIEDFPKSDVLHTRICNYVCIIHGYEAQQIADIVVEALKVEKNAQISSFECTAMLVNHWKKTDNNWVIDELRMDVCSHGGDLATFLQEWYFDEPLAKYYPGVHFPCINGELDSPWKRIPDAEDVLSEEEKIMESFAKYNFGVDNIVFEHVEEVLSDNLIAKMPPWGPMDKRHYLTCLKFHRQKDRYWAHPVRVKRIDIEEDHAVLQLYRMAGHKQRNHPYKYTKANLHMEHACGRYVLDFIKEDEEWKICKWKYYLGIVELGEYVDDLYGDSENR